MKSLGRAKRTKRFVSCTLLCLLAWSLLWISAGAQSDDRSYDVVIRNGRVLDGAGNPWILADVAIKDGRFVRVGRIEGRGKREIDARGKYVTPGWIDMMDQSGRALLQNGLGGKQVADGCDHRDWR